MVKRDYSMLVSGSVEGPPGRLIEPDPTRRIQSAEAANLDQEGAAEFHRQLVKGGLASEYENDIRVWLERLP